MKNSLGLFIGRMNPPHKGHISVIKKALQENDEVLILLGEGKKRDEKNPFTFQERKEMLCTYFQNQKLKIEIIKDNPSDEKWIQDIGTKIGNTKNINIYGGDFENDSAIQVLKAHEDILDTHNIIYNLISRKDPQVLYKGKKYDVSSTNLRQAIKDKDGELVKLLQFHP